MSPRLVYPPTKPIKKAGMSFPTNKQRVAGDVDGDVVDVEDHGNHGYVIRFGVPSIRSE